MTLYDNTVYRLCFVEVIHVLLCFSYQKFKEVRNSSLPILPLTLVVLNATINIIKYRHYILVGLNYNVRL